MFKRITAVLATVLAALMAVGIGSAAIGPASDDSTSTTSITSPTAATLPTVGRAETVVYEVGDAGNVTVVSDGLSLSIVATGAAQGWAVEVEIAAGREVEADFRNGARRLQFKAELEDGEVRVRVRDRADDNGGADSSTTASTMVPGSSGTTSTTVPSGSGSTSTTAPSGSTSTSSTIPDNSTTTSTTTPSAGDDRGSSVTYNAGDGGNVVIAWSGSSLTIVSVNPAAGWSYEVEVASGLEVEADFRNGTRRIQFNAEFEDGEVRIRVRDRADDNS